jgi:hypothetical protein
MGIGRIEEENSLLDGTEKNHDKPILFLLFSFSTISHVTVA